MNEDGPRTIIARLTGFSGEQVERFTQDWTAEQVKTLRQLVQIAFARGSKAATKRALRIMAQQRQAAEFAEGTKG